MVGLTIRIFDVDGDAGEGFAGQERTQISVGSEWGALAISGSRGDDEGVGPLRNSAEQQVHGHGAWGIK